MRTAEEWGRVAVSLPGWRWMPGMLGRAGSLGQLTVRLRRGDEGHVAPDVWPDPDDPATGGALLALLGPGAWDNVAPGSTQAYDGEGWWAWVGGEWSEGLSLGRACIAAAEAIGRWPGGEK